MKKMVVVGIMAVALVGAFLYQLSTKETVTKEPSLAAANLSAPAPVAEKKENSTATVHYTHVTVTPPTSHAVVAEPSKVQVATVAPCAPVPAPRGDREIKNVPQYSAATEIQTPTKRESFREERVSVNTLSALRNRHSTLTARVNANLNENNSLGDAAFERTISQANQKKNVALNEELGSAKYAKIKKKIWDGAGCF